VDRPTAVWIVEEGEEEAGIRRALKNHSEAENLASFASSDKIALQHVFTGRANALGGWQTKIDDVPVYLMHFHPRPASIRVRRIEKELKRTSAV